jgi:hypothetical protein
MKSKTRRRLAARTCATHVEALECRSLLSSSVLLLFPTSLQMHRPGGEPMPGLFRAGGESAGGAAHGIGPTVRQWTHSGITGRDLAERIHQLRGQGSDSGGEAADPVAERSADDEDAPEQKLTAHPRAATPDVEEPDSDGAAIVRTGKSSSPADPPRPVHRDSDGGPRDDGVSPAPVVPPDAAAEDGSAATDKARFTPTRFVDGRPAPPSGRPAAAGGA